MQRISIFVGILASFLLVNGFLHTVAANSTAQAVFAVQ